MGKLIWEELRSELNTGQKEFKVYRTKLPGGWLVSIWHLGHEVVGSTVFYADATHEWDGSSLS